MTELTEAQKAMLAEAEAISATLPKQDFKQRIEDLMRDPKRRKRIGELAGIPVEHQGPVFQIEEVLEIKGGKFRVRGFEGGLLHLEGVPR